MPASSQILPDPLTKGARLGPLVNDSQYAKVGGYIEVRLACAPGQRGLALSSQCKGQARHSCTYACGCGLHHIFCADHVCPTFCSLQLGCLMMLLVGRWLLRLVQSAKAEGARLLTGGKRPPSCPKVRVVVVGARHGLRASVHHPGGHGQPGWLRYSQSWCARAVSVRVPILALPPTPVRTVWMPVLPHTPSARTPPLPRPPRTRQGYFLEPTVFVDVRPDMRVWREEIFGPVLAVMTFRTEAEAVALANNSEFGLGGEAGLLRCMCMCRRRGLVSTPRPSIVQGASALRGHAPTYFSFIRSPFQLVVWATSSNLDQHDARCVGMIYNR